MDPVPKAMMHAVYDSRRFISLPPFSVIRRVEARFS
jgi:hypothetical protein